MNTRRIPYVRETELRGYVKAGSDTSLDRIMRYAAFAGRFIDRHCDRRFDECIDTLNFQRLSRSSGGRIDRSGFLLLDHDLKEVVTLVDASGVTQADIIAFGSPTIRRLRPDPYNGWGEGDGYIALTGKFGFGGMWEELNITLAAAITTTTATTFTVSADGLEVDMLLLIDAEYMRVTAYDADTNTATVKRGFNGSTAATHPNGSALYYFVFDEVITQDVLRLTAWAVEQQRSPMSGQVSIGDFTYPVNTDGLPKDVLLELKLGGYVRVPRM